MKLSNLLIVPLAVSCCVISCNEESNTAKEAETKVSNSPKPNKLAAKTYEVIPEESVIKWVGSKPTEDHSGTLNVLKTTFELAQKTISSGEIVVDMNTLKVTDIEDPEYNAKLLGHLKNQDFFSVDEFQEAQFFIHESMSNDSINIVVGELSIKGIQQPIEAEYKIKYEGQKAYINAMCNFDRTLFDIRYKSKSFFSDLGDMFIKDEIQLEINLVLALQ